MSIISERPQVSTTRGKTAPMIVAEANELIVFCPNCSTLETVLFKENRMAVPTRKFSQYGARIYHDCGSSQPCRLYRTS
ncbi:hypothetical protein ACFLWS_00195 [Chloroflexota bacterium]